MWLLYSYTMCNSKAASSEPICQDAVKVIQGLLFLFFPVDELVLIFGEKVWRGSFIILGGRSMEMRLRVFCALESELGLWSFLSGGNFETIDDFFEEFVVEKKDLASLRRPRCSVG